MLRSNGYEAVAAVSEDKDSRSAIRDCLRSVAVIVPTLNAGERWSSWLEMFKLQHPSPEHTLVIDSSSKDNTALDAQKAGLQVTTISRCHFNHGGTRQMGVEQVDADIIVFLTQDAILASSDAISRLIKPFKDPSVGAVYGRQLPHKDTGPFGAHARLFNYPERSRVVSKADIPVLGIKTAFISNSFSAFRRSALVQVGGFPRHTIMNEDTYAAAKLILDGWKVAYVGDAAVYHSHDYSLWEEFKRYFDIGVFHAREPWFRQNFGRAEGEGLRMLKSEVSYLSKYSPVNLPFVPLRAGCKYLGYKAGMVERYIPKSFKKTISMHSNFWN